MPRLPKAKTASKGSSTANIGFEAKLWPTADKLRNNMDAAEYKHIILGLIFLNYISYRFDELTAQMMEKIKANSTESRTLAALRDTLLPKLLSGELSVSDELHHPRSTI